MTLRLGSLCDPRGISLYRAICIWYNDTKMEREDNDNFSERTSLEFAFITSRSEIQNSDELDANDVDRMYPWKCDM